MQYYFLYGTIFDAGNAEHEPEGRVKGMDCGKIWTSSRCASVGTILNEYTVPPRERTRDPGGTSQMIGTNSDVT